jgi:hypothetical protein
MILAALALACTMPSTPILPPDWNMKHKAYDGVWLPRWVLAVERPALAASVAYPASKVFHLSPTKAAVFGVLATSVVPHIIGVARCAYPFDPADWAADAWSASFTLAVTPRGRWSTVAAVATWAAVFTYSRAYSRP